MVFPFVDYISNRMYFHPFICGTGASGLNTCSRYLLGDMNPSAQAGRAGKPNNPLDRKKSPVCNPVMKINISSQNIYTYVYMYMFTLYVHFFLVYIFILLYMYIYVYVYESVGTMTGNHEIMSFQFVSPLQFISLANLPVPLPTRGRRP